MIDVPPPLDISYFRHARSESLKSEYKIKMGACLVVGKSIFKGRNFIKTHPRYGYSVHAEISCLLRSRKYDIIDSTMYIYRESRGKPALAKPCPSCMKELREAGIKKVIFSTNSFPYWKQEIIN